MLLINWKFMHTFLGNFTTKSIYKSYLPNTYKTTSKTNSFNYKIYNLLSQTKKKNSILSIFTDHNHTSNYSPKHK
jgi:hypothetical protein